jgi:DNA-directed RNA polymerase specialized sigma24 family protein
MPSKLNASAAEFVPGSFTESWVSNGEDGVCEDHITPEELAELEAAEGWVDMLAELEDLEDEHLIAVALRYAPQAKVAEIQKRCGIKPHKLRVHKGIRARGIAKGF